MRYSWSNERRKDFVAGWGAKVKEQTCGSHLALNAPGLANAATAARQPTGRSAGG